MYVKSNGFCLPHLGGRGNFEHGYCFRCFVRHVVNVFVVSAFRAKGETQYFGTRVQLCMSTVMSLICKMSLVLYSGLKSVQVFLSELSTRFFDFVQA